MNKIVLQTIYGESDEQQAAEAMLALAGSGAGASVMQLPTFSSDDEDEDESTDESDIEQYEHVPTTSDSNSDPDSGPDEPPRKRGRRIPLRGGLYGAGSPLALELGLMEIQEGFGAPIDNLLHR